MKHRLLEKKYQILRLFVFTREVIATLRRTEKPMILRLCARAALAARSLLTSPTPCGLARKKGRALPQKGDFAVRRSSAIASRYLV